MPLWTGAWGARLFDGNINLLEPRRTLLRLRTSCRIWNCLTLAAKAQKTAFISSFAKCWPMHICDPQPNATCSAEPRVTQPVGRRAQRKTGTIGAIWAKWRRGKRATTGRRWSPMSNVPYIVADANRIEDELS